MERLLVQIPLAADRVIEQDKFTTHNADWLSTCTLEMSDSTLTCEKNLLTGVSLDSTDTILEKKSRLSKSLEEFMQHRDAIPQLIQYLEACKGKRLRVSLPARMSEL